MSESGDDDWFEKDIDELVQEMEKKLKAKQEEDGAGISLSPATTSRISPEATAAPTEFKYGEDYGGSYNLPPEAKKKKGSPKIQKEVKTKDVYVQTLPIKTLASFAELSPVDAFLEVAQKNCGFIETFYSNLSNRKCSFMIKILAKICSLPLYEFKLDLLPAFAESEAFHIQVFDCLKDDLSGKINFDDVPETLVELLVICKDIYRLNLADDKFKAFIKSISNVLNNTKTKCPPEFLDPVKLEFCKIYENKLYKPTDISENDIYPTLDELKQDESLADLKPNIVEGKFDSVQHYLDIHKSLLREDFISPLRELIAKLRNIANIDKVSMKDFYKSVRFLMKGNLNLWTKNDETLLIDINPNRNKLVQGVLKTQYKETFKNFMTGALLCLTTSLNFHDLILAIVARAPSNKIISEGYVEIEIIRMYNITRIFEKEFIMFESKVFFEPYHQVFKTLNRLDESNFPMANYIVDCDKTYHPPDYLCGSVIPEYKLYGKSFDPLNPDKVLSQKYWCKLQSSQIRAFLHALRNKFSLIQGPPGTGKTYVGLQILKTLIRNTDAPILIICYTNHALDQFLAGILETTTNIVRMGNQSKNSKLDQYNVKQCFESNSSDRRHGSIFYEVRMDYKKRLQEFEAIQKKYDGTDEGCNKLFEIQRRLRRLSKKLDELSQINVFNLIKDKRVIGMTTTYAARSDLLLELLKTPIIIFEEAAEVLEAHIVASLRKSTQHVILIGDHKQLRPTTSVYKMSEKYKMDISLFERMVNNNLNSVCLKEQFRMRKEIADLLRPTIYEELFDDYRVLDYKNIKGMDKNVFFITHDNKENKSNDETSKSNVHEAEYLAALAHYLILQGYLHHEILFLTPYNGQIEQFRRVIQNYPLLQKVRIRTVDNFQGEETKIVLLSLVRNNCEGQLGFLAMKNRICVSLSRAREGLYIMGNINLLSQNNKTWKDIRATLEAKKCLGEHLPFYCMQHKVKTPVKTIKDFGKVKFGGCNKKCIFREIDGHVCAGKCHSLDWEYTI